MNSNPRLFRHGDLLIQEIFSVPSFAKPISTNIIAEGEKTGHNHELNGPHRIYEMLDKNLYFEAKQDIELKHPEHNTIRIPNGNYVIVPEREHDPFNDVEIKVED